MGKNEQIRLKQTEIRMLTAKTIPQGYDLYIALPDSYAVSDQTYPVIYILDGQWDFSLASTIAGNLHVDLCLPECLMVGVTYSGESPEYDSLRAMDLSPSPGDAGTGRGPQFLEFVKEELIPFIESEYRVTADRTLCGSSFGGLFVLYTLLSAPTLFRRLVSLSPFLNYDHDFLFAYEDTVSKNAPEMPFETRLFLAVGGQEERDDIERVNRFSTLLTERAYPELECVCKIIEGGRHSSMKAEGFNQGLQYVFARTPITLSDEEMQEYSGQYALDYDEDDIILTITPKGNHCEVLDNGNLYCVYPEAKDRLFCQDASLELHFTRDEEGGISEILVRYATYFSLKGRKV